MDDTNPPFALSPGSKVEATVERITSYGLIVKLDGHRRGIVRTKELTWDYTLQQPWLDFKVGEKISVVVLDADRQKSVLNLSYRQALGDPWDTVRQRGYVIGQVVAGEVFTVTNYGAFVQLSPGITALLHKAQFPTSEKKDIRDLLWPGDWIRASIIDVNPSTRRIMLSIIEFLESQRRLPLSERAFVYNNLVAGGVSTKGSEQLVTDSRVAQKKRLNDILRDLAVEMNVAIAALFQVDPVNRVVTVVASIGLESELAKTVDSLYFSPVQDVAVNREVVFEIDAIGSSAKWQHLLSLTAFASCVGIPIPVPEGGSSFALFLFHDTPNRFSRAQMPIVRGAAYLVAASLREVQLEAIIRSSQRYLNMGQLAAGMVHELSNHLDHTHFIAQILEKDSRNLLDIATSPEVRAMAQELIEWTARGMAASSELVRTLHDYSMVTWDNQNQLVSLNHVVHSVIRQVQYEAKAKRVQVSVVADADLPLRMTIPGYLHQVFLNLVLNAIQQIATHNPQGGNLRIATAFEKNEQFPIKVRFIDSGPGIHRSHWDWIFGFGNSTRSDGSGLGLYVSKSLINEMGGRIRVERSEMAVGS